MLSIGARPDDTAFKDVDCAHVLDRDSVPDCATLVHEWQLPCRDLVAVHCHQVELSVDHSASVPSALQHC